MSASAAAHAGKGNNSIVFTSGSNTRVRMQKGAEFTFTDLGRQGSRHYYRAAVAVPR